MTKGEVLMLSALESTGSTWITKDNFAKAWKNSRYQRKGSYESNLHDKNVIERNGLLSTSTVDKEETDIAVNVMRLLKCSSFEKVSENLINKYIADYEKFENEGRELHYRQKDAVRMAVNNTYSILTGGPGTGKTTVISCIMYVIRRLAEDPEDVAILLTAPTGKAARRMSESTGESAITVHKLFGLFDDDAVPIDFEGDVLVIDESSFNDNHMMAKSMAAIKTGKKVLLVGDTDQLPSVGIGAVLRDLIACGEIPVTQLTHTFRQDNSSVLFTNICNIREGKKEIVNGEDYHTYLLPNGESEEIEKMAEKQICDIYVKEVEKYGIENVAILIPYRRSKLCSNRINNTVQKLVNKEKSGYRHTVEEEKNVIYFKKGDLVMQLENRPECANGEVGKVLKCTAEGLIVQYTDATVEYAVEELDQLALAYAMSIHKSQGSEYSSVIMLLLEEHEAMLQRNLLYTGVTRAKKEMHLVYQKKAYNTAVSTIADENRLTLLKQKIVNIARQYHMAYGI